ncbi:MAG TPA: NUDIX domain-containing protein [Acidobacteriota bacterium]|nr:NUDIX domain-containing protein [Acidobacteriota bacterium]
MIREFSAGIVPFRAVRGSRIYLLLKSGLTLTELWEFPKGMIEKGEDSLTAALREFREETGINECKVIPGFKKVLRYFYRRGGKNLVSKTVSYYLGEVFAAKVVLSHESTDYEWVTFEDAGRLIRHRNVRELLAEADGFLSTLGKPADKE